MAKIDPQMTARQKFDELLDYMIHATEPRVDQMRDKITELALAAHEVMDTTTSDTCRTHWSEIAREADAMAVWCESKTHFRYDELQRRLSILSQLGHSKPKTDHGTSTR